LPVVLKFDKVNITKKEITTIKTDWPEFFKTDKWRIDYRLNNQEQIDICIDKIQKFILKAYKQSSTVNQLNKRSVIEESDQAAIKKLIKLRNYYRRKKWNK